MYEWQQQIQIFIDEIDQCIKSHQDDALTLHALSCRLGYSEFYVTRKFREISGIQFRDYLRLRRLAFALREVRAFPPMKPSPGLLKEPMALLPVNTAESPCLWCCAPSCTPSTATFLDREK